MCLEGKHAGALTTLAFKYDDPSEAIDVSIIKKTLQVTEANLMPTNPSMSKIGDIPLFRT